MRGTLRAWLVFLIVLAAFALTHLPSLRGWWLYDDPQLLLHARRHSVAQILFSPQAYRTLASHTFTPLLSLSFKLDDAVSEEDPRFFYRHQLLMLAVASLLFFVTLKTLTASLPAAFGTLAFVVAPATALVSRTLMTRHYLEGCVAALAAIYFWTLGPVGTRRARPAPLMTGPSSPTDRAPRVGWREFVSALFYFLSLLAKEVYALVPLLLVIVGFSRGESWRRIVWRVSPHAVAAAIVFLWRAIMLESPGGYTDLPGVGTILWLPWVVGKELVRGLSFPLTLVALTTSAVLLASSFRPRRSWWVGGAAILLFIFLPIVPLAGRFEWRYAFAASTTLIFVLALAAHRSRMPASLAYTLLSTFIITLVIGGQAQVRRFQSDTAAMLAEGRFIENAVVHSPILLATSPGWYLSGICEIRPQLYGFAPCPRFVLSLEPFVLGEIPLEPPIYPAAGVRESRFGGDRLTELSAETRASIHELRERLDPSLKMNLLFKRDRHALRWELEPAAQGTFTFLTYPYYGAYPIPAKGWNRIPDSDTAQFFRVRVTAGDGRWNISPVIPLPKEGSEVRWSGPK